MAWKILINGVDVTAQIDRTRPLKFELPRLNGRASARFTCRPGLFPSKRQSVVIYAQDGTTPLYKGLILQRKAQPVAAFNSDITTTVDCGDNSTYADWCVTSLSYDTNVTLAEVLTDLLAESGGLGDFGITLHGSQATGPTLSPFSWSARRVSDALRDLTLWTGGYAALFGADDTLRMLQPGSLSAPVSVTDAAPNCQSARWQDGTKVPANRIVLLCGPSGSLVTTQHWTGDGSTTEFEVDIPAVEGGWQQGYVLEDGTTARTVSLPGQGGYYEWDDTDGRGTIAVGSAGSTPANGTVLEFIYTGQYPFQVIAASGDTPPITQVVARPDIVQYAQGVSTAEGLLGQFDQEPRTLAIVTREDGFGAAQSLTVSLSSLKASGTFVVEAVEATLIDDSIWEYAVTAIESTTLQGSSIDAWRELTSGGSGVTVAPAVVTGGSTGAGGSGTVGNLAKWALGNTLTDGPQASLVVLTSGAYSNPSWITGLSASKLTSGNLPYAQLPSGDGTWTANPTIAGTLGVRDIIPSASDAYDLGRHDRLFAEAFISQLTAIVFAEATQTLFGGYSTIGHGAGALGAAVTSGATTIDFGQTMTPGDWVLIRAHDTGGAVKAEYLLVGSNTSGTTYNVTRDLASAHGTDPAWAKGTPFLILGQSGDGRIDLLAYDGKPRIVFTEQGSAYNAQTDRAVIGNLNGYFGYATDTYGAAFGDPDGAWVKIDPVNGVRIGYDADTNVSVDSAGVATLSEVIVTGRRVVLNTPLMQTRTEGYFGFTPTPGTGGGNDAFGLFGHGDGAGSRNIVLANWAVGINQSASLIVTAQGSDGSGAGVGQARIDLHSLSSGDPFVAITGRLFVNDAATFTDDVTIASASLLVTAQVTGGTFKFNTAPSTAATGVSAVMAASNYPGANNNVHGWLAVKLADDSTGYIPVWK